MWMSSSLIQQCHQARKDRAGKTRATNAIFVIVISIREGLRLTNKQTGLGITKRSDIGNSTSTETHPRLIPGLRKNLADTAARTIEPSGSTTYKRRRIATI